MTLRVGDSEPVPVLDVSGPVLFWPPLTGASAEEIIPLLSRSATAEFSMVGGWGDDAFAPSLTTRDLTISAPVRPAWWGRLRCRLTRRDPGTYVMLRAQVVTRSRTGQYDSDGQTLTVGFEVVGPVEVGAQPASRLEARWHRLCAALGRP
jgi:hypothetical protein